MISRRSFLKNMGKAAGITGLAATGTYSWFAEFEGLEEDFRYLLRDEKPKYYIADSHAHPKRPENIAELESIIKHLLGKNILFQSISAITKSPRTYYYEQLREDLTHIKNYELEFSDEYASIVRHNEQKLVFIRSQEVTCLSPYGKEVHIGVEGTRYFEDCVYPAEKVIESALKDNATAILNHPYTIRQEPLIYWIAYGEHEEYIKKLMRFDGLLVEAFNSQNVMHMAAANGKSESLAIELNKIRVASTDCHYADSKLTLDQLGIAGFYIEQVPDLKSLSGKEIIQLKRNLAENSPGLYRNYCAIGTFWDVMINPRLSKIY